MCPLSSVQDGPCLSKRGGACRNHAGLGPRVSARLCYSEPWCPEVYVQAGQISSIDWWPRPHTNTETAFAYVMTRLQVLEASGRSWKRARSQASSRSCRNFWLCGHAGHAQACSGSFAAHAPASSRCSAAGPQALSWCTGSSDGTAGACGGTCSSSSSTASRPQQAALFHSTSSPCHFAGPKMGQAAELAQFRRIIQAARSFGRYLCGTEQHHVQGLVTGHRSLVPYQEAESRFFCQIPRSFPSLQVWAIFQPGPRISLGFLAQLLPRVWMPSEAADLQLRALAAGPVDLPNRDTGRCSWWGCQRKLRLSRRCHRW